MSMTSFKQTSLPEMARIVVRPLTADDSEDYRLLRKRILEIGDGKYFSDSYIREKSFTTLQQWRDWCTETQEHCTIGTFLDGELIGIMGIVMYGPPESLTVEWEVTWLDPRYREFGFARRAYEYVHQWTKDHGYEYAIVFIRDDNTRSRHIREAQGAIYLYTKYGETWADGSIADVHCFILDLAPTCTEPAQPYDQALRRIEATLASLKQEDPEAKASIQHNIQVLRKQRQTS